MSRNFPFYPKGFTLPPVYQGIQDKTLVLRLVGGAMTRIDQDLIPDISGNDNHGKLVGGMFFTNTPLNHPCLRFDGSDDYVNCGTAGNLHQSSLLTVSCWVKQRILGAGTIVSRWMQTGNQRSWALYLTAGGVPSFYSSTNGTLEATFSGNKALPIEKFSHLVLSYDGIMARIYVDGILDKESAVSTLFDSTASVWIGNDGTATIGRFDGLIDDVRIYNRALSVSEASQLYNESKYLFGRAG